MLAGENVAWMLLAAAGDGYSMSDRMLTAKCGEALFDVNPAEMRRK
jgi:hypothetical protein